MRQSKRGSKFEISEDDAFVLFANYYFANVKERNTLAVAELVIDKETRQHIKSAAEWASKKMRFGLLMTGKCGSGKSTLSKSMAQSFRWFFKINDYSLISTTSRKVIEKATTGGREYDMYRTCDMLFIDDLGVEPSTVKVYGNEISPVTDILYDRYDAMRLTVATSNFAKRQLGEIYGQRLADRFAEMFSEIGFNNPSYRR